MSSAGSSFSVVIPYYNGDAYVGEAIASALAQTYPSFEVLVIDDGSPAPGSSKCLDALVREFSDSRVRVFHKPNEGLSATRNFAIARARGDLVALLDQDDVWLPYKLEREAEVFAARSEVDLVFSKLVTFGGRDGEVRPADLHGDHLIDDAYSRLLKWDFVPCATTTFRKRAVDRTGGFDSRYRIVEEYDLFLRLARAGMRFYFIDEILGKVRLHANNYTRNFEILHAECLDLLRRYPARGLRQRYNRSWNRAVIHAARGRELLRQRRASGAGWLCRSLLANPIAIAELAVRIARRKSGAPPVVQDAQNVERVR